MSLGRWCKKCATSPQRTLQEWHVDRVMRAHAAWVEESEEEEEGTSAPARDAAARDHPGHRRADGEDAVGTDAPPFGEVAEAATAVASTRPDRKRASEEL
jgi:hypothetical protein